MNRRELGKQGEIEALAWLRTRRNLDLIAKNFYTRYGEIDLIFEEKLAGGQNVELVFVEVRLCTQANWLRGPETIGPSKLKKQNRVARIFLTKYHGPAQTVRFDLLHGDGKNWIHLMNAWNPDF